jgi:hypothetical protein
MIYQTPFYRLLSQLKDNRKLTMKKIFWVLAILLGSNLLAMDTVVESNYYGKVLSMVDGDAQIVFGDDNR